MDIVITWTNRWKFSFFHPSFLGSSLFHSSTYSSYICAYWTWKVSHFCEKLEKTWNSHGIFYDIYLRQGKSGKTDFFSPHIIFKTFMQSCHAICCQKKGTLSFLHSATAIICTSAIYWAPFSLPILVNMWNGGQGKSGFSSLSLREKSENSREIFYLRIRCEPW